MDQSDLYKPEVIFWSKNYLMCSYGRCCLCVGDKQSGWDFELFDGESIKEYFICLKCRYEYPTSLRTEATRIQLRYEGDLEYKDGAYEDISKYHSLSSSDEEDEDEDQPKLKYVKLSDDKCSCVYGERRFGRFVMDKWFPSEFSKNGLKMRMRRLKEQLDVLRNEYDIRFGFDRVFQKKLNDSNTFVDIFIFTDQ